MIFNELMTGLNEAVGMESYVDAPMTELEEMNAEIQDMIALESAFEEMEAYSVLEFADNVEATSALLAMRECGLESTQGMDPAKIYEGFGIESTIAMEAAKDVLARKAYAGIAAIKALIATCIKWLKSLFGVTVASKKVMGSLAKKADAMLKDLGKKANSAKIDSEKLVREIPAYNEALAKFFKDFTNHNNSIDRWAGKAVETIANNRFREADNDVSIKDMDDNLEAKANYYVKSETSEISGSELITALRTALETLSKQAKGFKTVDPGKKINTAIKELEKYRRTLDNVKSDDDPKLDAKKAAVNSYITRFNKMHTVIKSDMKGIVRVSDDLLTMSKGVLAAIY